jgi:ADP-L-glycero-D-manno-heptose 6-epimerase
MVSNKIVITGTDGFIGKNLYNKIKDEYCIMQLNENTFDKERWWEILHYFLKQFQPDAIFHVGACSNTLETDVNYMMTRNYEYTKIVSDYCVKNNVKLIYSSSAANYGINNTFPSNLYGWSKYIAENYVVKNGGIALRYFNVYGPGESHKENMASVAYQMKQNDNKGNIVKLFPNNPKRDFVYIDDVIDANLYALNFYDELKAKWYEVGSGEARSFEDVLRLMNIPFEYTEEKDIPKGYQMFTKSKKDKWMKGWEPKFNLENGIEIYKNYLKIF